MRAADFYFGTHQTRRAMEQMARVLADTDTYADFIFDWYADRKLPAGEVLAHGLPAGSRAPRAYLHDLMAAGRPGSGEVWTWITARGLGDARLAREYTGYLFCKRDYQGGARAWAQYLGAHGDGYPESNRIFNGDFESELSDSAFDWRINARD